MEAARGLSIKERRVEEWRSWGVIPSPLRVGNDGRRPRWLYPPRSIEQLTRAADYRPSRRKAEAVVVALWIDGFDYKSAVVRAAIASTVRIWYRAQSEGLLRHAPPGIDEAALLNDKDSRDHAVKGLASEWARRRSSTLPLPRDVRVTLPERERAMRYLIASMIGIDRDEGDAVLLERVAGLSRGRSADARGITWTASESIPIVSLSELDEAVEHADELAIELVRGGLQTMVMLVPSLVSIVATTSPLRPFLAASSKLLQDAPYATLSLLAAVLLRNIAFRRQTETLTPAIAGSLNPNKLKRVLGQLDQSPPDQPSI